MRYNSKSNKKPKSETFLVASSNTTDLANQDQGADALLFDPTTPTVANIANGQLGIICAAHDATVAYGAYLDPLGSETVNTAPIIQFVQGTPNSADIQGVEVLNAISDKEVVRSQPINGQNMVLFTGRASATPRLNAWHLGGVNGQFDIQDQADYAFNFQFKSVRNDKWFGAHGNEDLTVNFSTPNYTALGTTSGLDHFIQNVVYNINLNSHPLNLVNPARRRGNRNILALAIDDDGGNGGTELQDIVAGTAFQVGTDTAGNAINYTPDAQFVATLQDLVAGSAVIDGTSTVVVTNLTTAGDNAWADNILVFGLDSRLAFARDDIPQRKTRLRVGVEYISFVAATPPNVTEHVRPFEGEGDGRRLGLWYDKRAGLNIYTAQNRHWGPQEYITPPDYIDRTIDYNVYIIEHKDSYYVPASHDVDWYHRTIILIPCTPQPETISIQILTDDITSGSAGTYQFEIAGTQYAATGTVTSSAGVAALTVQLDGLLAAIPALAADWTVSNDGVDTLTFTATDTAPKFGTTSVTALTGGDATFAAAVVDVEGGSCTVPVGTTDTAGRLNTVFGGWLATVETAGRLEKLVGPAAASAPFTL